MAIKLALLTVLFLPLLQPIWQVKPFNAENIRVPDAPTFLTNDELLQQQKYFLKEKDPRIRSRIVISLIEANNPKVIHILETLLKKEQNEVVIADILRTLFSFRDKVKTNSPQLIKKFIKNNNPAVRSFALAIYLDKTKDINTILKVLKLENSVFISNFITNLIMESPNNFTPNTKLLEELANSKFEFSKVNGLYLLAYFATHPEQNNILKTNISSGNIIFKTEIAKGLIARESGGEKLLKKLSTVQNPTIRAIVAKAKPTKITKEIFLNLTNDSSWEVRRLACKSLASYQDNTTLNYLLRKCDDLVKQVRDAAENSIIKIKPNQQFNSELTKMLDQNLNKKNAAIHILGELKEKKVAKKILNILKTTKNKETIQRSIIALGLLDYKKSWKTINKFASSKSYKIRKATLITLGQLAQPGSFDTIIKLSKDKKIEIKVMAIKTMGDIASPYFNDYLTSIINNVSSASPDMRAAAAWSLARINKPNDQITQQLKKLVLKKVISVPGARLYDSNQVRLAATMALIDFAKKDKSYLNIATKTVKRLKKPPLMDPEFNTKYLRAFAQQAYLYLNDKKPQKTVVDSEKPMLVIEPN